MEKTGGAVSKIRVLSADDHTIVRTGLQMILRFNFGILDFFEASSCGELVGAIRRYQPSHLIIDMIFRDGNSLELLPTVVQLYPRLPILVYSMLPPDVYEPVLRRHGIQHYLHKGTSQEEIDDTLRRFFFPQAQPGGSETSPEPSENPFTQLSQRELEVLHYLLRGDGVSAIGSALNLHKSTVSTLKSRIFEKLRVGSYKELLEKAIIHQIHP